MKSKSPLWPWILATTLALWALSALIPRRTSEFDFRALGQLPVLLNGRLQPLDSVARNSLLQLRDRQTVRLAEGGSLPAIVWLWESLVWPERADRLQIFRIDHPEILGLLDLPQERKYFSADELRSSLSALQTQAERAEALDARARTPFERRVLKLYSGLILNQRLKNSLQPEGTTNFVADLEAYRAAIPSGVAAAQAREAGQPFDEADFNRILLHLARYREMSQLAYPLLVPPSEPAAQPDAWESMGTTLMLAVHGEAMPPAVTAYAALSTAYRSGQPAEFNRVLAEYRDWLDRELPGALQKTRYEFVLNQLEPFYRACVIYILGFLLACGYWIRLSEPVRRLAFATVVVGFVIHTAGLGFRMALEGRPPVTNLYSSAIFIGWGTVLLGGFLERFYRNAIGLITAALVGFVTLIIAHHLALGGDTMEMMRAVLDSNFWLATHVVTITIGYSATFAAGVLGILLILLALLSPHLTTDMARSLGRMIYGVICFATFFSFLGTVLGGIWADQSWGRFWGWDPKENGALIIVLWNAIILHARWGGMIGPRGIAALAVFGNVVTSYSWFGVNMHGVGLHSYGFMEAGFIWLFAFVASQLAIIGLAFLPPKFWKSPIAVE